MLGGIKKTHVFRPCVLTFARWRWLHGWSVWKDDRILRGVAAELEREGITICESTFGSAGHSWSKRDRSRNGNRARKNGTTSATGGTWRRQIGRLDIGQCVVIKDRVVVAVEAVEGTDGAIEAGANSPTVERWSSNVANLSRICASIFPRSAPGRSRSWFRWMPVLAVEAGRSVLLDREILRSRPCRYCDRRHRASAPTGSIGRQALAAYGRA